VAPAHPRIGESTRRGTDTGRVEAQPGLIGGPEYRREYRLTGTGILLSECISEKGHLS
jgi:hypothetical protein